MAYISCQLPFLIEALAMSFVGDVERDEAKTSLNNAFEHTSRREKGGVISPLLANVIGDIIDKETVRKFEEIRAKLERQDTADFQPLGM